MHKQIIVDVSHVDPVVEAGLSAALRKQADFEVADTDASDPRTGASRHVVVTDYAAALALVAAQRANPFAPSAPPAVLVMTTRHKESDIRRALEAGVRGYLLIGCSIDELVGAVRSLSAGMRHLSADAARLLADSIAREALTPREADVLALVVEGLGNKAIARALDVGIGTVKSHLRSIYGKLDATTRTEAVTMAERRGLLDHIEPLARPAPAVVPAADPQKFSRYWTPARTGVQFERTVAAPMRATESSRPQPFHHCLE